MAALIVISTDMPPKQTTLVEKTSAKSIINTHPKNTFNHGQQ
jgi:hypothetical protein